MYYVYTPDERVCPERIQFNLNNDCIYQLKYTGGCEGIHLAMTKLADGMNAEELIDMMEGIRCPVLQIETSCCDQLAKAIKSAMGKIK